MSGKKNRIQDTVTAEWVREQFKKKRVTIADVADFYGLNYMSLHQYVSGKLNMSKTVKGLFWMYLKYEVR